jgi:hypothetical protein
MKEVDECLWIHLQQHEKVPEVFFHTCSGITIVIIILEIIRIYADLSVETWMVVAVSYRYLCTWNTIGINYIKRYVNRHKR